MCSFNRGSSERATDNARLPFKSATRLKVPIGKTPRAVSLSRKMVDAVAIVPSPPPTKTRPMPELAAYSNVVPILSGAQALISGAQPLHGKSHPRLAP